MYDTARKLSQFTGSLRTAPLRDGTNRRRDRARPFTHYDAGGGGGGRDDGVSPAREVDARPHKPRHSKTDDDDDDDDARRAYGSTHYSS